MARRIDDAYDNQPCCHCQKAISTTYDNNSLLTDDTIALVMDTAIVNVRFTRQGRHDRPRGIPIPDHKMWHRYPNRCLLRSIQYQLDMHIYCAPSL